MEEVNWKKVVFELWRLLDDIDTADDMFKEDNKQYREYARIKQQQRWTYLGDEKVIDELYEEFAEGEIHNGR